MARIRSIKPELADDDRLASVDLNALALFFLMKPFCDDRGIIAANIPLIKSKCFPQRETLRRQQVEAWIDDLAKNSLLVPYTHTDGKGYYVLDFAGERIDKPQPSIIPDAEISFATIRDHSRPFRNIPERSGTFANTPAGKERKGKEEERKGSAGAQERFEGAGCDDETVNAPPVKPPKPPGSAPPPSPPPSIVMPWPTESFATWWGHWKTYRKEQHAFTYRGLHTEQLALTELSAKAEGSEAAAIEILKHTMANGWKGFVKPKPEQHAQSTLFAPRNGGRADYADRLNRAASTVAKALSIGCDDAP